MVPCVSAKKIEDGRHEVHYLAHTVAECRPYFDAIGSPALAWAYTVNHAHLMPEGIGSFRHRADRHNSGLPAAVSVC